MNQKNMIYWKVAPLGYWEAFERELIDLALEKAQIVQTKAAKSLGITERHLWYKLKKYGMK